MTENRFIAASADVYGDVILGEEVSIWFQAVLRGDENTITIGNRSNIQDGSVVHVDYASPVKIGKNVTIGHQCIIHGCTIEDNALIGMGSIILNDAVIGENSLVGAGSLVTQKKTFPPNSLIMGSPAKFIRTLTSEEIEKNIENAQIYARLGKEFNEGTYKPINE